MKYDDLIGSKFYNWTKGIYTPSQIEAFKDYDSFDILNVGSFRSGKTEFIIRNAIKHAYYFSNASVGVFRLHSVTLKRTTMSSLLSLIHPSWVKYWSNSTLELKLINNSVIYFIGAESPDKLGSLELTHAAIDEASEVPEESLNMIQGRMSGKLHRPSNYHLQPTNIQEYIDGVIDKTQVTLACNPKSKSHYLYQLFFNKPRSGFKAYTSNSISNENLPLNYLYQNLMAYVKPDVEESFIRQAIQDIRNGLADLDGLFLKPYLTAFGQRNLLGLWVALEGAIYNLDEDIHTTLNPDWVSNHRFIAGVDFGFHNPRLIILEEFNHEDRTCYEAVDYWYADKSGDDLVSALLTLDAKYDIDRVYFPHDQPGIVKAARTELGASKCRRAKNAVTAGIVTVTKMLPRRLRFRKTDRFHKFWDEMTGYSWGVGKDGIYTDQPIKVDDHFPDSLRYAIYSAMYGESLE